MNILERLSDINQRLLKLELAHGYNGTRKANQSISDNSEILNRLEEIETENKRIIELIGKA